MSHTEKTEEELHYEAMQTLTQVGLFHGIWMKFDLHIETAIAIISKLDFETANIMLHGLSFSRKVSILKSLLHMKDPKHPAITAIQSLQNNAKRNAITHGLLTTTENRLCFTTRETTNKFRTKHHYFTFDEMNNHVLWILSLLYDFDKALDLDEEKTSEYDHAAVSLSLKSDKLP